jgi:hypothetical protein
MRDEMEARREVLDEHLTTIAVALLKLGKEYKADFLLLVNAPHLSVYERVSHVERLSTVDQLAAEVEEIRAETSVWLDTRLSAEGER